MSNEMLPTQITRVHESDTVQTEFNALIKEFGLEDSPECLESSEATFNQCFDAFQATLNSSMHRSEGYPLIVEFKNSGRFEVGVKKILNLKGSSLFKLVVMNKRRGADEKYVPLVLGQGASMGQALFDAIGNLARGGINVFDKLEVY